MLIRQDLKYIWIDITTLGKTLKYGVERRVLIQTITPRITLYASRSYALRTTFCALRIRLKIISSPFKQFYCVN